MEPSSPAEPNEPSPVASDSPVVQRPSRLRRMVAAAGVFAAGVLVGLGAMYFGFNEPALGSANARLLQFERELNIAREQLNEVETTAAAIEGQLRVEESTRRSLEAALGTVQAELGHARDTLAFYEQLIPPGPEGAVSIRALDVARSGPHLKYRLLLMRTAPQGGTPFKGELQFTATGRLNGEPHEVRLLPAVSSNASAGEPHSSDEAAALAVEFSEFQRSSGVLALPDDFEPESITVNVLEGRTVRVTRSVDVPVS